MQEQLSCGQTPKFLLGCAPNLPTARLCSRATCDSSILVSHTHTHRHTLGYCLTSLFVWSYSGLRYSSICYTRFGQCPKLKFWELLWQDFLQVRQPTCRPTSSTKALKDKLSLSIVKLECHVLRSWLKILPCCLCIYRKPRESICLQYESFLVQR